MNMKVANAGATQVTMVDVSTICFDRTAEGGESKKMKIGQNGFP